MRWLITGGCGFIGTNLIKAIKNESGHYIRVVDNLSVGTREALSEVCRFSEFSSGGPERIEEGVELVVADILDDSVALQVTDGIDVLVHLAANTGVAQSVADPRRDCQVNVMGTLNYLEAARLNRVQRFIFASSGAPLGAVDPPIHEEIAPHPVSPYGASKLAGEGYCSAYSGTFGVETIALRFGNVYGPGSIKKNSVVAKFLKDIFEGGGLEIFGDGSQTRDFIFVEDLVDAILRAAKVEGIGGEIFQIATSRETSVKELAEMLCQILLRFGVRDIATSYASIRQGDVQRTFSDTRKANARLGWTARYTLAQGLEKTVGYFLNEQKKRSF